MSVFLYLRGNFRLTEQLEPESPLVPGLVGEPNGVGCAAFSERIIRHTTECLLTLNP